VKDSPEMTVEVQLMILTAKNNHLLALIDKIDDLAHRAHLALTDHDLKLTRQRLDVIQKHCRAIE